MIDKKAIDILESGVKTYGKEDYNIKIFLGDRIETFLIMLQDIIDIINNDNSNLNELNSVRLSLIETIKEKSDLDKGVLILNPLCYKWMKNEIKGRDLSLIKYFNYDI